MLKKVTPNYVTITWHLVEGIVGCGGNFESASGIIISPNYPNPYPHNAQCVWIIHVPEGERVTITFTQVDLEDHRNCMWDYVEVSA